MFLGHGPLFNKSGPEARGGTGGKRHRGDGEQRASARSATTILLRVVQLIEEFSRNIHRGTFRNSAAYHVDAGMARSISLVCQFSGDILYSAMHNVRDIRSNAARSWNDKAVYKRRN